jgi:hypothetical protein
MHGHLQIFVVFIGRGTIADRNIIPSKLPRWKCNMLHIDIRSRGALTGRKSSITVLSNFKLSVHEQKGACTSARETRILMRMHEVQYPKEQFRWQGSEGSEWV